MPTRYSPELRYAVCLLALFLLALGSHAQEIAYGTVKGTVRYDDGLPYIGTVNFTIQGPPIILPNNCGTIKERDTMTRDGSFEISLPAASWDIAVADIRRTVTVAAKQTVTVELTVKRTRGVLITVISGDGHPIPADDFKNIWLSGAYVNTNGQARSFSAERLSDSRFWLYDVPADIASLQTEVRWGAENQFSFTKTWTFTTADPQRSLTVLPPPLLPVAVRICAADGQPARNTRLYRVQIAPSSEQPEPPPTVSFTGPLVIDHPTTDANGMLLLGTLAPQTRYLLTVNGLDAKGTPQRIEVDGQGQATPDDYRLTQRFRTVKHRVVIPDGTPAPRHPMRMSYSWNGEITLREGVTDAHGDVTWHEVPPVAAVVWGPGIPPGEVAADSATIQPVTKPSATGESDHAEEYESMEEMLHGSHSIIFTLDGAEERAGSELHYAIEGISECAGLCEHYESTPLVARVPPARDQSTSGVQYCVNGNPTFGTPVNILLWTRQQPTRYAALFDCYLPREGGVLRMPVSNSLRVRLRLRTPDGTPVSAIDVVGVCPDGDATLDRLLSPARAGNAPLAPPVPLGQGEYELALPCSGAYRLVLNVNRPSPLTPPGPRFTVTEATRDLTITMPQPLAMVPPGTEVYCLPLAAPARPVTVVAPPGAARVPVFIDQAQLLAWWYRSAPDKLVLWNRLDGSEKPRVLSLQKVIITVKSSPYASNRPYHLLPLLPSPDGEAAQGGQPHADPHRRMIPLITGKPNEVLLWPGRYAVMQQDEKQPFTLLEIAEGRSASEVTLDLDDLRSGSGYRPVLRQLERHYIRLNFPAGDGLRLAENTLLVTDDTGTYRQVYQKIDEYQGKQYIVCTPPKIASKLTIQALGVGIVRDLDVSEQRKSAYTIEAWQPGVPLAGSLFRSDGTRFVGLVEVHTSDNLVYRTNTDPDGHLSIAGMMPGGFNLMMIHSAENASGTRSNTGSLMKERGGGWYELLPPGGMPDIRFGEHDEHPENTATPVIAYSEYAGDYYAWWFGDHENAICTPKNQFPTFAWNSGGWLWEMIPNNTMARPFQTSRRFTADDRVPLYLSDVDRSDEYFPRPPRPGDPAGPSLGISLPFTPGMPAPGPLTITGLKDRAPAILHLPEPQWAIHPMLGCVTLTLPGIPPGDYQVTFLNGDTVVKHIVTVTPAGGTLLVK